MAGLLALEHAGTRQQAKGRFWRADEELVAISFLLIIPASANFRFSPLVLRQH